MSLAEGFNACKCGASVVVRERSEGVGRLVTFVKLKCVSCGAAAIEDRCLCKLREMHNGRAGK